MDRKLLALISLFFISFAFFAALTVGYRPIITLIRAREDFTPSPARSRIIAWPLSSLKSDGLAQSEINVFIVSNSDKPIANKVVTLSSSLGQIKENSVTTDNNGKATMHLISTVPGIAEIQATVDNNIVLSQKITVKFD